jgi:hypothetical protein
MRNIPYLWFIASLLLVSCSADDIAEMAEEEAVPLFHPTADWMQQLLYDHPDESISLRDICLPRSHDAGMYVLQNCTIGANACNVQTQDRDMRTQLMDGIRMFDIRPLYKNNGFFTRHSRGCDGLGCYGARVETMLQQLREFLDEHNELVFIEFSFWCYTDGDDPVFRNMLFSILGDRLYRESGEDNTSIIDRPLEEILPPEQEYGKAIALVHGAANTGANRAEGIFSKNYLPMSGRFSNAQDFPDMKADQFEKYRSFAHEGNSLFKLSWTLTQDADQALACLLPGTQQSLESMANSANAQLSPSLDELIASGDIGKGRIPHVISVDFCEEFVTEACIRISNLNLAP